MKKAIILTTIILALLALTATGCSSCADNPAGGSGVESGASADESGTDESEKTSTAAINQEPSATEGVPENLYGLIGRYYGISEDGKTITLDYDITLEYLIDSMKRTTEYTATIYENGKLVTTGYVKNGMTMFLESNDKKHRYKLLIEVLDIPNYIKFKNVKGSIAIYDDTPNLGLNEPTTIEKLISDPLLAEFGYNVVFYKNGVVVTTGSITEEMKLVVTNQFKNLSKECEVALYYERFGY
jgi:hypothetical protein